MPGFLTARDAQQRLEAGIMDHATKTPSTSPKEAEALPPAPDLSGKNLGDFHLLRRLGQGGMGQVYLAEQISLKRKVAIKVMRTDLAVSAVSLERLPDWLTTRLKPNTEKPRERG